MNILFATNTYLPHVGGVARSVALFAEAYRKLGHRVLVIAPEFPGMPKDELDVLRIPAIQNFNGSDFSVRLPIPVTLFAPLAEFKPDIVHSHHPFLLGDTAIRVAALHHVPLVFTHHTMYEQYTHYVPGDSPELRQFVIQQVTGYANLCHHVFAPSESVKNILGQRGVDAPISVVPTGVNVGAFGAGDGEQFRRDYGIPPEAFVIGHVGRLAPEKNLTFLGMAARQFLTETKSTFLLIVGQGPARSDLEDLFADRDLQNRVCFTGSLQGQNLINSYHAMNVFIFASFTETQGMVLAEALATGAPVVALDAPGAREVVQDGINGRLLKGQNREEFAKAIHWVHKLSPGAYSELRRQANASAATFSTEACAIRALGIYEALTKTQPSIPDVEDTAWAASLRLIEREYELFTARAEAASKTLSRSRLRRFQLFRYLPIFRRKLQQILSRAEWTIKLLGLKRSQGTAAEPGLVLVQIDGLSYTELERALLQNRLPFLRRLIRREGYRLYRVYSGVPSTTPAVQGELFYGVSQVVPSFAYYDRERKRVARMYEPETVERVENALASALHSTEGLLLGGSSYSNVFAGGAEEVHFSPAGFGWGRVLEAASPWSLIGVFVSHGWCLVRAMTLMFIEGVLAIIDCVVGIIGGQDLIKELKFVPTRLAITILLREFVTSGAVVDIFRGRPIISLNYLGYDEQSHRRGPSSYFAHWTLKGIDASIRRLWRAARRSAARDYDVWIYSDHGQETTRSYVEEYGISIEDALAKVIGAPMQGTRKVDRYQESVEFKRARWVGGRRFQRFLDQPSDTAAEDKEPGFSVVAMGPLGHLYLENQVGAEETDRLARTMVNEAHVPLVVAKLTDIGVVAWTRDGRFALPENAISVFGADHPFLEQITADIISLASHPMAGNFIISGFHRSESLLSFPIETGAHGGPGARETTAFALLPRDIRVSDSDPLRMSHLRERALVHLKRKAPVASALQRMPPRTPNARALRVMTYNVHSCVGTDRKLSPLRIARVIAHYNPDIIALQELDVGRARTEQIDQAHAIAHELEMEYHFHPTIALEEERYGDAVLSRFPLRLVKAAPLPRLPERPFLEPRGALWVAIMIDGVEIHFLNTHLGLIRTERELQIATLLGPEWLSHPSLQGPVILCGDFNAFPSSKVYRQVRAQLADVQEKVANHRPKRTWSARIPFGRIDHIFVSKEFDVRQVEVPRTFLTTRASDHLPIVADLEIVSVNESGGPR